MLGGLHGHPLLVRPGPAADPLPQRFPDRARQHECRPDDQCQADYADRGCPRSHATVLLPLVNLPSSSPTASTLRRYWPVNDPFARATSSGDPAASTAPPAAPPSGPRSMTQSAVFTTSRLCSITTTVLPLSTNRCSTSSSSRTSSKCRPVVGSSRMYRVRPVSRLASSVASLTRCASPPDRVVADCPRWMYPSPTSLSNSSFALIRG